MTLGPNLTKDRLFQDKSIPSSPNDIEHLADKKCGPPEIDRIIRKISKAENHKEIEVLYWPMEETITNARKILPIWVKQGVGYQKHINA